MPRRRHHYVGNPEFQHLRIKDDPEPIERKEPCPQHHESATSEGLSYVVEGEEPPLGPDGRVLTISRDAGSEETKDFPAEIPSRLRSRSRRTGTRTGIEAYEQNESPSRRMKTSTGPPPRELRVRLTKNLSTRMHSIRRFVDFTICNSVTSQKEFQVLKDEEDVYRLKNHDYLLRLRITIITKRDRDDPYLKDYIAELKFRGRLYKYNADKESFEELAVVSQCMAVCAVAECRRVPTYSPPSSRLSP